MPLLFEERKTYTDVVKGASQFENESAVDFHFARADCEGSTTIAPMGIPMVWVDASSAFEVFIAQTIPAAISSLPDASPVCVVVGEKEAKGLNRKDITLTGTSQDLTVLYRGPAAVVTEGIDFGAASAPNIALFKTALEKQNIAVISSAPSADPAYITA